MNDGLNPQQKIAIMDTTLGGLLEIASSMPVDLSQWVMKCYDPVKSELVIPDRGSIPVNTESAPAARGVHDGLRVLPHHPQLPRPVRHVPRAHPRVAGLGRAQRPVHDAPCRALGARGGEIGRAHV